ncbi:MAG: hypothetical protein JWM41_645 [Gemmatimonadetes bacterium]|nr:hypothetical protein [Gemmatimonadota bacterium]
MTQPLGRTGLHILALTASTAVLIACAKPDARTADSGAAPAKVMSIAPQPGALGKAVDQYSGDELFDFAHGLAFTGGNERQRRCRGRAECRGPRATRSTRLRVDAVDTQDSLSAGAMPPNGVIAARVLNRGQVADTMYGMRPGNQYEYYLIVSPGAQPGVATWRLEELTTTVGSRSHRSLTSGRMTECNHPFKRGARADFKTCAEAAPVVRPASFSPSALPQTDGESPIWVACAFGCCTADPPDGG